MGMLMHACQEGTMVRELQLARRLRSEEAIAHETHLHCGATGPGPATNLSSCEHRAVARDGRIVCARIVEGDNEVSPNTCRACPFKAVNCAHLRFSLRQTSSTPLIVRHNGRTEIWDDQPAALRFERAACSARVIPVAEPRSCAGCLLRQAVQPATEQPSRWRSPTGTGKVVPFRGREALAPTG